MSRKCLWKELENMEGSLYKCKKQCNGFSWNSCDNYIASRDVTVNEIYGLMEKRYGEKNKIKKVIDDLFEEDMRDF